VWVICTTWVSDSQPVLGFLALLRIQWRTNSYCGMAVALEQANGVLHGGFGEARKLAQLLQA
jgi:hypothetical protein